MCTAAALATRYICRGAPRSQAILPLDARSAQPAPVPSLSALRTTPLRSCTTCVFASHCTPLPPQHLPLYAWQQPHHATAPCNSSIAFLQGRCAQLVAPVKRRWGEVVGSFIAAWSMGGSNERAGSSRCVRGMYGTARERQVASQRVGRNQSPCGQHKTSKEGRHPRCASTKLNACAVQRFRESILFSWRRCTLQQIGWPHHALQGGGSERGWGSKGVGEGRTRTGTERRGVGRCDRARAGCGSASKADGQMARGKAMATRGEGARHEGSAPTSRLARSAEAWRARWRPVGP